MKHEIDRVIEAARAIMRSGGRGVVVTLLRTSGSTYRRAGARAVIDERGIACGLVSGGCIERDLAERMHEWLAAFEPRVVTYDSTSDADIIFGSGLGCRGTLELLVEPFDADHPPAIDAFRWNGREPVVWTTRLGDRELLVEAIRPRLRRRRVWCSAFFAADFRGELLSLRGDTGARGVLNAHRDQLAIVPLTGAEDWDVPPPRLR